MIRHIIVFKLSSNSTQEAINDAINGMCALENKLFGILRVIAGESYFHDEKSTRFFSEGMSHSIIIDFVNENALDNFFHDPITHSAKDAVVKIAEGGYAGIVGLNLSGRSEQK
jgi:formylmethanofuran:tetrahydromethanopterin formyltransferase